MRRLRFTVWKSCPEHEHRGGHLPCVPTPVLLLSACRTRRSLSYSKKLAAFLSPPR